MILYYWANSKVEGSFRFCADDELPDRDNGYRAYPVENVADELEGLNFLRSQRCPYNFPTDIGDD